MKKEIAFSVSLVLIAVVSRLITHQWNFTMMGAVAVIAGFLISNRPLALATVLSSLLISDYFIQFHNTMITVYLGYTLMALIGIFMASNKFSRMVAVSFIGSVTFFVVSNLGVWFEGQLYPQTFAGLINCFEMAVPFFRNEMISTMLLAPVLYYSLSAVAKQVNAEQSA
ncbi:MAG: hypothetical protein H7235_02610 [Bdellovibrionaceae bacterium]|nr:hypothetical protein [Pseudobdellovibrionaceae bacterium]